MVPGNCALPLEIYIAGSLNTRNALSYNVTLPFRFDFRVDATGLEQSGGLSYYLYSSTTNLSQFYTSNAPLGQSITGAGMLNIVEGSFDLTLTTRVYGLPDGQSFTLTIPTNSIDINYATVPEPSTYALAGTAGLALLYLRRRRR